MKLTDLISDDALSTEELSEPEGTPSNRVALMHQMYPKALALTRRMTNDYIWAGFGMCLTLCHVLCVKNAGMKLSDIISDDELAAQAKGLDDMDSADHCVQFVLDNYKQSIWIMHEALGHEPYAGFCVALATLHRIVERRFEAMTK